MSAGKPRVEFSCWPAVVVGVVCVVGVAKFAAQRNNKPRG